MSEETIYIDLELSDRFNVAFPDERIPNGFIDKTKTRVGITYTNFHDNRNTITVIPSEPIIDDALTDYDYLNLFAIRAKVTPKHIEDYLQKPGDEYKRLVTTPESFGKIITAAMNMKKLQWLYDNFFLYLDEVHCYATEAFRVPVDQYKDGWGILTPFHPELQYVWEFKDMAMGSATPFEFSHPRIQPMQRYKLRYKEKFGTITIVNDYSPIAALQYMLLHPNMFPGNVHVFFNTVTQSGEVIRATGITDVNIYCRDDERNMMNLEEASQYFKSKPVKEEYSKFNFYSCRYNDGWDLKDDETATIILVTDVNIPHSLIGIPYKGFQAVGRLKVTPNQIYHITNDHGKSGMRSFKDVQSKWLYNANQHIVAYNTHATNCKREDIDDSGLLKAAIKTFSTFKGDVAHLCNMTLDQIICKEYCNEHYNNPSTIKETWASMNYNTIERRFNLAPVITVKKSKAEINKQVIERHQQLINNPDEYVYEAATATIRKYQTEYHSLFEAYAVLGPVEIAKLEYEDNKMKEALIKRSNDKAELKLRQILIDKFKLKDRTKDIYANRYPNKLIKAELQKAYDFLGIKKLDGSRKIATAEQLKDYGLFQLEECKALDEQGNKKPGLEVVKENYSVSINHQLVIQQQPIFQKVA